MPPLLLGKELLVVCNVSETPEQCPLTSQVAPCFGGLRLEDGKGQGGGPG